MNNQQKLRELLCLKLKLMRLRRKRLLLSVLQKPRRIYQHNIAKTGASKQSMYMDPLEKTLYAKRNLYVFRVESRNFLH